MGTSRLVLLLSLWTILLTPLPAKAEPKGINCAAFYGIRSPRWPCQESVRFFKRAKLRGFAFLMESFGDRNRCVRKILRRSRFVQVFIINGSVGVKYPAEHGDYAFKVSPELANKRIADVRKLLVHAPSVGDKLALTKDVIISPVLEWDGFPRRIRSFTKLIREGVPEGLISWNPKFKNGLGRVRERDFTEYHGFGSIQEAEEGGLCIANNDGSEFDPIDPDSVSLFTQGKFSDCPIRCVWIPLFNLFSEKPDKHPSLRVEVPKRRDFGQLLTLIRATRKIDNPR